MANKEHHRSPRRGSVLLLVLIAVSIMTLCTASFLLSMENEYRASWQSGRQQQARHLADSGIAYLSVFLGQSGDDIASQGGLYENESDLQGILVADDVLSLDRGRFSVFAPALEQGLYGSTRYGLENESAKLNLNTLLAGDNKQKTAARDRLLQLPGMESPVADAILDWLDSDNLSRDYGAEDAYYSELQPPYEPRNGPFTDLDELLLVRGVTPELLYGVDFNRNYVVDENEQARGAAAQADYLAGELDRGWAAYLTIHSLEKPITADGTEPIDVNSKDLKKLHGQLQSALGDAAANFIVAFRQYPVAADDAKGASSDPSTLKMDFEKEAKNRISSVMDLLDIQLQETDKSLVPSPWKSDPASLQGDFLELLDHISLGEKPPRGRVNINQASRPVLRTIPKLSTLAVDQILTRRDFEVDRTTGDQRHTIWLLAQGIVTLKKMKQIEPHITAGGEVYSAQVVGYFDTGSPVARIEVILDRSESSPRLLGWRDLTRLGPGFSPEALGIDLEAED